MLFGQVTFDSCDNSNHISSNSPSTWGATYLSVSRNIRGKLLRIRKQYLQLWVRISTLNVSNWGERKWKQWININLNGKWRCELYPRKRLWLWHDHISINSLKHTISKVSTCWEIFKNDANLSVPFPTPTYNSLRGSLHCNDISRLKKPPNQSYNSS